MNYDQKDASGSGAQDPGRLRFDGPEDALNFIRDFVERGDRLPAPKNLDIAKEYVEGRVDLVMHLRAAPDAHVFDLVFRRVPPIVTKLAGALDATARQTQAIDQGGCAERDKDAVRLDVPYGVQSPQGLIPSLVWAETFHERADCRGNVNEFPVQLFVDSRGGWREREAGLCGGGAGSQRDGAGVHRVVESVPQVAEGVLGHSSGFAGEARRQSDLVHVLAGVSVVVDHAGVWLSIKECLDPSFEIVDVIPCVSHDFSGAIEGIVGHGEIQET